MQLNYPPVRIRQLKGLLGFTRQSYYQYWHRQTLGVNPEEQLLELVKEIRKEHPRMGGRKLYQLLQSERDKRGIKIGRDAFLTCFSNTGCWFEEKGAGW